MAREQIEKLKEAIAQAERIVFFGGAGVSTESGIPDFRSETGLYAQNKSAEELLSYSYFKRHPEEFFAFYRTKLLFPDVRPNYAHEFLAGLEAQGKLNAVITQNVDGLHQMAGSKNVIELHGTAQQVFCDDCKENYPADAVNTFQAPGDIPLCACGGVIRPAIVMFEEPLDEGVIAQAIHAISQADMLIIGGTSLSVYPAASFIDYFRGKWVTLMNKGDVSRASRADIVIRESLVETFRQIH